MRSNNDVRLKQKHMRLQHCFHITSMLESLKHKLFFLPDMTLFLQNIQTGCRKNALFQAKQDSLCLNKAASRSINKMQPFLIFLTLFLLMI